jgi:hypothetical protein
MGGGQGGRGREKIWIRQCVGNKGEGMGTNVMTPIELADEKSQKKLFVV